MSAINHRSGTVLIVVAGVSGLIASLTLAFLVRNRSEVSESIVFMQEAQARIMLIAACSYIQEASRIGWDEKSNYSSVHLEAYGWIDVRDGFIGPKPFSERTPVGPAATSIRTTPYPLSSPATDTREQTNRRLASGIPIGNAKRFPMYVLEQPPYAIQNRPGYNLINQDPSSPDYLTSYLRLPDPQPVASADFTAWETGKPMPRQESFGLSWFRLLREPNGSTFLVTCGGGGTMGYRNWQEIITDPDPEGRALFPSEEVFNVSSQGEVRLFYRVEWSPAIMAIDNHLLWHHGPAYDHYEQFPMNLSVRTRDAWGQLVHHNMGGTIPLIQRLRQEPPNW